MFIIEEFYYPYLKMKFKLKTKQSKLQAKPNLVQKVATYVAECFQTYAIILPKKPNFGLDLFSFL